jgi:hypothetical protein
LQPRITVAAMPPIIWRAASRVRADSLSAEEQLPFHNTGVLARWQEEMLNILLSYGMAKTRDQDVREQSRGITKGWVKKTLWFHEDEAEALRERAYKSRRSEASLIREAVRRFLGIED